jgi:hypothetical protein
MSHCLKIRLVVACAVLLVGSTAGLVWGEKDDHEDAGSTPPPRTRARQGATVPLECGLSASERVGTPLSATFELEGGKRHLVVATMQGDTFLEVIVDDATGKVATVEAMTSGEALTASTAQGAVMVKATKSLRAAVEAVLTAHPGFRALCVVLTFKGEQPVAEMTLVKDGTVATVVEPLN